MYEKIVKTDLGDDVKIVDLRTDTISKPTQEMREAMYTAEVGDDVYGEDPTVTELERASAELLGKEDAVFVVSGTMANLIAVMVHCSHRGSEILLGDKSHVFRLEQGGAAQIAGVQCQTLKNKDDGTFSLDELREKIRKNPDIHEPITSLVVIENTHNLCGGKVLPLDWIEKVNSIGTEHNIPLHMDGARLFNAAVCLKVTPRRIVRDVDSVCFCLSKGLGCPVGAMLVGSTEFITRARRMRKVLGGGWRQAGVLAAAGLVALDTMINRLRIDHEHAYKIAKAIHQTKSNLFKVDLPKVQTNILLMYIDRSKVDIKELQRRLQTVLDTDTVRSSVRCSSLKSNCVRFVLYHEISEEDVQMACDKIQLVIREYDEKFKLAISDLKSTIIRADSESIQTNIVIIHLDLPYSESKKFVRRLAEVRESDSVKVGVKIGIREGFRGGAFVRLVTHWEVSNRDVDLAISKLGLVAREFEGEVKVSSRL